jgi:hypothetical protein
LPLTHTLFTHEGNDIITKDNAKNIWENNSAFGKYKNILLVLAALDPINQAKAWSAVSETWNSASGNQRSYVYDRKLNDALGDNWIFDHKKPF